MKYLPESARREDYPRLVRDTANALVRAVKSLQGATDYAALADYADDAAAAAGGVEVGSLYRSGSTVKVRVA